MKYIPFNLCIEINNQFYQFASISTNKNTEELFYNFYKRNARLKHSSTSYSKNGNCIKNINTGEPEHISFHHDGTIHLKCKKYKSVPKSYWQTHKLPENIFEFINQKNAAFPLLIDSYFNINNSFDIKKIPSSDLKFARGKQISSQNYVWKINTLNNFSVVLILYPKTLTKHTAWQEYNPILKKICHPIVKNPAIYIDMFKGTKLFILLSNLVASQPLNPKLTVNNSDPKNCFHGYIIGPTWENIKQMQQPLC